MVSFIKSNSKRLATLLGLVLMLGIFLYYTKLLSPKLNKLEVLQDKNEIMEDELEYLQGEYALIGQRKRELEDLYMESRFLEEQVPSYEVSFMMMSEIIEYMEVFAYDKTKVRTEKPIIEEGRAYQTMPITINYTTTYENSLKFLEMINRSYQMLIIDSYLIDNQIQEEAGRDEDIIISDQTVESQLLLNMYFKEREDLGVYPNFMAYLEKEENIFARPREEVSLGGPRSHDQQPEIARTSKELEVNSESETKPLKETRLKLDLADILRSGDNYSFSGYSPDQEPSYVGLTSSKDTKIVIRVKDQAYSCLIEDAEGRQSKKTIEADVINPEIEITSQIQNVMEIMPRVSIYIHNERADNIDVKLQGRSLENVFIYREKGKITVNR